MLKYLDSYYANSSYREEAFLFKNPKDNICKDYRLD